MATASRLNNNLLPLSWKPALNVRSSNCRPKPLQFNVTNNSFSGLNVETFRLNSTSSPRINNNDVADAVSLDPVGEKEAVNLKNLNKASCPFDAVKKAFDKLKSKSASVLLASWLLIGLMFISCQRPAFASIWKSLKIVKGCSFCSSGCIWCSNKILEEMKFGFRIIFWIIVPVFSFTMTFLLRSCFEIEISSFTSIFTIQVGMLVCDDLLSDLNSISETLDQSGSDDLKALLNDMVEVLDSYRSELIYGYSSGITVWEGIGLFSSLLFQERKRFDKKRPVNLRNSNTKRILQNKNELENRFVVVTLMMAFEGWHKLPSISKRRDLDRVLKKIESCNSKTKLENFNILYVPEENDGSFTAVQVENNYPLLRPL